MKVNSEILKILYEKLKIASKGRWICKITNRWISAKTMITGSIHRMSWLPYRSKRKQLVIFYEPILISNLFSKNNNIIVFKEQISDTLRVAKKYTFNLWNQLRTLEIKWNISKTIICNLCYDYYNTVIFRTHLRYSWQP